MQPTTGQQLIDLQKAKDSELNRHRVRNEPDYCPTKIGSLPGMARNTHHCMCLCRIHSILFFLLFSSC
jgi:hypothetical protein